MIDIEKIIQKIEQEMQRIELWQALPPQQDAFLSEEPFAIDTMEAHEWLQWIFVPRMRALLAANASLPRNFALCPYFEEAYKEQRKTQALLQLLRQLDELASQ